MTGVIYHPHFEPSLSWLRSSLLVYNNVWSIVPKETEYVPSESIKRHLEKLPDTFAPLAPEPPDIVHEYFVLNALKRAFAAIAAQSDVNVVERSRIRYGGSDSDDDERILEISGITKLHDAKLAYVVYDMLKEHDPYLR